jgi:hypothetical protein
MRGPSNNRLISAFLFALVLIAMLYSVFWYHTMKKTEEGLVSSLRDILGGDIYYDHAEWEYDITKVGITVKNTVAHFKDDKRNLKYIHSLGDLKVESDFFQNFHILINLPQQQNIKIEQNKKIISEYRIALNNAALSFYPNIEGGELIFSTDAIHIIDKKDNKLLSGSDLYFIKSGGGRTVTPHSWRISTNKLNWHLPILDTPLNLYSVLFDTKLRRFPTLTMKDLYAFMLEKDRIKYSNLIIDFFSDLNKRGSTIAINEVRLSKDKDDWTALSGDIDFGENLKPNGLLSVNTNQPMDVNNWLVGKNIVRGNFLSQNRTLNKLFRKPDLLSMSLSLKGDVSYINGLVAGDSQPITSILGIKNKN